MDIAAVFLVMTADMVEANLGQRVSQPMWDAPELGAKQNKSSAVPGMKYTWLSSLFDWKQAFLSLQQLSHKCPHLHPYHHGHGHRGINSHDKQTLLKHCSLRSIHILLYELQHAQQSRVLCHRLQSQQASQPTLFYRWGEELQRGLRN